MARKKDMPCSICGELLWRSSTSSPSPICRPCRRGLDKPLPPHGTRGRYRDHSCKCDECRAWASRSMREYAAKVKARDGVSPTQKYRPRKGRTCDVCGKVITSNAGNAADGLTLCNPHRIAERKRQRRRASCEKRIRVAAIGTVGTVVWVVSECKVCKASFTGNTRELCCSVECTRINRVDQRRTLHQRRRARKRNAFRSNVSPRKVFEADGYRCHICNRKTDPTKKVPHPKAPTVDHVIPLSRGGTHEPVNCRTACFLCNATKSDRMAGDQMLLLAV